MRVDDFAAAYPELYHLAEAGSWASIERHGLLSVGALLDLFEVEGKSRDELESRQRLAPVIIEHPQHGRVVLRDQKPLSEAKLAGCLVDMAPAEWIRLLNGRVFFWLDRRRLDGLLEAKEYRGRSHDVIAFDTKSVLSRHGARAYLSPINSGSTLFKAAKRGRQTFRTLALYDILEPRPPVELTIEGGVPDAREHVLRVEVRRGANVVRAYR